MTARKATAAADVPPPADFSGVTGQYDHGSYTTGDPVKVSITGKAKVASTINATGTMVDDDGATGAISLVATLTKLENVKLQKVVDTDGRTWTVSVDGLSATTTA